MKNFGFGLMRLPMNGEEVDIEQVKKMTDRFLEEGFTYFDTAHPYIKGKSETAIREALVKRYPRESFLLADKLSPNSFNSEEEIRPVFNEMLEACGVEYFDYFLMHAQSSNNYQKYCDCRAYEIGAELKAEGKIKHLGFSFHDSAEFLEKILTEKPMVEFVQLQFNYVDYEDPSVESRKCYEVCRKFNKPVIVMEPVKGGSLVNLPEKAQKIFDELNGGSNASYAIRFAASFDGIMMVLSGMGSMEMMNDNISYMKDFQPLSDVERNAVNQVRDIFRSQGLIPCTACRYCTERCPQGIAIPDLFACLNAKKQFNNWNQDYYYNNIHTKNGGKANSCIGCGKCEAICPQHLEIRALLKEVSKEFDKE